MEINDIVVDDIDELFANNYYKLVSRLSQIINNYDETFSFFFMNFIYFINR